VVPVATPPDSSVDAIGVFRFTLRLSAACHERAAPPRGSTTENSERSRPIGGRSSPSKTLGCHVSSRRLVVLSKASSRVREERGRTAIPAVYDGRYEKKRFEG